MADSKAVVKALSEVDPGFQQLCDTLFGPLVDPDDVWAHIYAPETVVKAMPDSPDLSTPAPGALRPTGRTTKLPRPPKVKAPVFKPTGGSVPPLNTNGAATANKVIKADRGKDKEICKSVTWEGTFSKVDDERRQVFGWASVVEINGEPVVDGQGDFIEPQEIEKAAYSYVEKSRRGGNQHKRTPDDQPFHASNLIESIVFTDEKIEKMGLPGDFPRGWWVGYQVHDEDTWQDIKAKRKLGFSIHGKGKRQEVEV